MGIGTAYIESFTSYIRRLASEHGLLTTTLISKIIIPNISESSILSRMEQNARRFKDGKTLNGTGITARDWVQTVEDLNGRTDLRFLTWLSYTDVMPVKNLLRQTRAWCSDCYNEWLSSNKVIYEPLLWTLEAVNICLRHKKALRYFCPCCKSAPKILARREELGFCTQCSEWLGNFDEQDSQINSELTGDKLKWQSWIVKNLGDLLSAAPSLEFLPVKETISKKLSIFCHQTTGGNMHAFARYLQMPQNMIEGAHFGRYIPLLKNLLQICYYLQQPLLDFLLPESESSNSGGSNKLSCKKRKDPVRLVKAQSKKLDSSRIQEVLQEALISDNEPPPLEELAKSLECSRRSLYNNAPDLCAAIVERRKAQRKYLPSRRTSKSSLHNLKVNPSEIREKLQFILNSNEFPSSLTEIAAQLNCSPSTLYYHAPELYDAVVQRRQDFQNTKAHPNIQATVQYINTEQPRKYDTEELRRNLTKVIEEDEHPPKPLKVVAEELGHKVDTVYDHASDLCHIISKRYKDYKAECKNQTIATMSSLIQEAVFKLHSEGKNVTKRAASLFLPKPAYIREKEVDQAFHEAVRQLGLEP
jgi:AraC-like DNA-binding protein